MKKILLVVFSILLVLIIQQNSYAQGVTTASMTGFIQDDKGEGLPGANVVAIHVPSGTQYGTSTQVNGRYNIPGMRTGGPYKVTVSFVGYKEQIKENIYLNLGTAANVSFTMVEDGKELSEVVVTATRNDVFSSERTGAATNIGKEALNSMPTLSRSLNDFTRLTPQASGNGTFGGADNRFNNITIDGSIFNNSFGLAGQPGGRTNTSPISLDAIEEVQVSLAPYDVRQAGFTGAGVNAVTKSGTNELSGSMFYNIRNQQFVGTKAKENDVITQDFNNTQYGFRLGGPIIKNKLFFFANAEIERRSSPGTNFRANTGGETVTGNVTRVLQSDLDQLSAFMRERFNYETGPYQGYNNELKGDKFLIKLDYNINDRHKLSVRYTWLNSQSDILLSNSTTVGGDRRSNLNSLNYKNSNYIQGEKIRSIIGELNSNFKGKFSNNLIIGYTYQNEDRVPVGQFFPLIDILQGGQNYISLGFEPFTPNNKLDYSTFQMQDNLTYYGRKHTITGGFNVERFAFNNVFFPFSNGSFAYNSLQDFYSAANAFLTNPNATVSPVQARRYRLNYSALPGGAEPVQPTRVTYVGAYLQDEFQAAENFKLTFGVRFDIPFFDNTGYRNPVVEGLTFRDETNAATRYSTDKLPDPAILWSPRLGFNWDVFNNKTTQIRGGSGIFTGRPAFVWISNQIGNNGVLTGLTDIQNTTAFPFSPDVRRYIPANPTLPPSFNLALTDPNFRFPQIWRTNIAVDQQLPWGVIGTVELIYSRDVNGVYYIDANREAATTNFTGPDSRPRFPGSGLAGAALNNAVRINDNVTDAIVLKNNNKGSAFNFTVKLEKPFSKGFNAMVAYNYGASRNLVDPGSIAFSSWTGYSTVRGNNLPDAAFSNNDQRHRIIGAISYRLDYGIGATSFNLFWEGRNQGRFTYSYNGDMNGDGVNGNDLLYIPRNASETVFLPLTVGTGAAARTFSPQEQADAFERFIQQDEYLNSRRGQYAERNGAIIPWIYQADFSIIQDFYVKIGGKRNTFQIRADINNVGNLINKNWGVGRAIFTTTPLAAAGVNAQGVPQFRMVNVGTTTDPRLPSETYRNRTTLGDVWQAQLSLRYIFN
jgi:hypothetical protein